MCTKKVPQAKYFNSQVWANTSVPIANWMCILGVGRQTAQQMISGGVSVLYLALPQEVAFELENMQPWEPLFYIIWRLISTFQQSAWENKTYYWE